MNNLELQTRILSEYLKIDKSEFEKRQLLNPTFNKDVRLFIDPMLLKTSRYKIFSGDARNKYEDFFQKLCQRILFTKELTGIDKEKAKQGILRDLRFGEQKGLGLGYSRYGTAGRGTGHKIAEMLYNSAEGLILKGSNNIGIFSVLFLLEEGFGPDYVSDMTAHIIIHELASFSEKMANEMGIKTEIYGIDGRCYKLPKHPLYDTYLFFVPRDILSPLDRVLDVKDVLGRFCAINEDNDIIRQRINQDIAEILKKAAENKESISEIKRETKDYIKEDKEALKALGLFVNSDKKVPYDFSKDSLGFNILSKLEEIFPSVQLSIDEKQSPLRIIESVIDGFVDTMQNNNKILRCLEKQKEGSWQSAFLLYCKRTCEENNIDISPEAETGLGPVDFKLSHGNSFKILIELKLSSSPNWLKGLDNQLEIYKKCTGHITKAYYMYIDLEKDEKKSDERIQKLFNRKKELNIDSKIVIIDGKIKLSASKS